LLSTMSWRQWSITVLWFAAVLSVVGQTSPVTVTQCVSSGFGWAINQNNQTPCLVAAYLESACGDATNIPAVPAGNHYLGPTTSEANPCRCNSVTYSAISACAGCQNRTYTDWSTWKQSCTVVYLTIFPESLPSAVEVPSWAYLDITLTNNNFSIVAAELNASETSTTSSAVTTSTSISNSLTPSSTALASATTSASNSKSNAGAIAGGVVGGIGFVAIVGLGTLWFFLRRKRNKVQQNIAFDRRALVSGTGMSQNNGSSRGILSSQQSIYTSDMRSTLYPETLFTSPGVNYSALRSLENDSEPPSLYQFGQGPQSHVANVSRGYTGVPEI